MSGQHADFCNQDHQPGTTPCARIVRAPRLHRTALELLALPEGSRVTDATGDTWTKVDGWWVCQDASCRGEGLIHAWGPIYLLEDAS